MSGFGELAVGASRLAMSRPTQSAAPAAEAAICRAAEVNRLPVGSASRRERRRFT
ncbi:hypothetical protein GCM10022248_93820 [Nonomuraea soli]